MAVERASASALSHFDPADLLDALSTGIVMLDAQLCPVYANVAAQDLLAFSLNMARGRPFADFLHDAKGLMPHPAARARDRRRHRRPRARRAPRRRAARGAHARCHHHAAHRPHRHASAARARRHHAAPAHHARERPAGAPRRQPPDDVGSSPTRSKIRSAACAARRSCSSASCRRRRCKEYTRSSSAKPTA